MKELKLTSPSVINSLIEEYDFKFSKSLGQNFLADENILKKIIESASLDPEDMVLEIGPGIGALTFAISNRVNKIAAVEIDKSLIPLLDKVLKGRDNVIVIHGDILKTDLKELEEMYFQNKPFKVIANLPYYITSPIIMNLLESNLNIDLMVFTLQKEVAQRLTASPGNKDYGAITVAINYYCQAEIITYVSKNVFMPRPNVDSAIVRLIIREQPPVEVENKDIFFNLVKTVFRYRRKTLLNALAQGGNLKDKVDLENLLKNVGIDPMRRGETLSIEEFAIISNIIKS